MSLGKQLPKFRKIVVPSFSVFSIPSHCVS